MNDIETRDDLFLLVQRFYDKLLADPSISYFFASVAKINLEDHLPILVDFWDMALFQSGTYQKNVLQIHLHLNALSPITQQHFETWLNYFNASVDELFAGERSFLVKQRAKSIATVMQVKIIQGNPA